MVSSKGAKRIRWIGWFFTVFGSTGWFIKEFSDSVFWHSYRVKFILAFALIVGMIVSGVGLLLQAHSRQPHVGRQQQQP
jgi:hypothetical protein